MTKQEAHSAALEALVKLLEDHDARIRFDAAATLLALTKTQES